MASATTSSVTTATPPPASGATPAVSPPLTTPSATSVATSALTAPSKPGEVKIAVAPATEPNEVNVASATVYKNKNVYHYVKKKTVEWKGEQYRFKINYPCENWEQLNPDELNAMAEEYADYLVSLCLRNLDAQQVPDESKGKKKIEPGDDISIILKGEQGMVLVGADQSLNPMDYSEEDLEKLPKVIKDTSAEAKALCQIIESTPNEKQTYPSVVHDRLHNDPKLSNLQTTVNKRRAEAAGSSTPKNLVNSRNACYGNTAFHTLVDDPSLVDELSNPENFDGGNKNRLYKAIQEYRQNKSSKLDIFKILEWDPIIQQDIMDAWTKLRGQFNWNEISPNSHLRSVCDSLRGQIQGSGDHLDQVLEAAWTRPREKGETGDWKADRNGNPPDVLTLHAEDRIAAKGDEANALKSLTNEQKKQLLEAIWDQQLNDDEVEALARYHIDDKHSIETFDTKESLLKFAKNEKDKLKDTLLSAIPKAYYLHQLQSLLPKPVRKCYNTLMGEEVFPNDLTNHQIELANEILVKSDLRSIVLSAFLLKAKDDPNKQTLRNAINAKCNGVTRIATTVQIDPNGKVTLKGKKYDLVSCIEHTSPSAYGGHFIYYVRRGNKCYRLDDLSLYKNGEEIPLKKFIVHAQKASFYTFHAEGLRTSALASTGEDSGNKPQEAKNACKTEANIGNTTTKLSVEEGSMKNVGKGFALVNQSDVGLKDIHPQMQEVLSDDELSKQIRTAENANETWKNMWGWIKPSYGARSEQKGIFTSAPGMLLTYSGRQKAPIMHIPISPMKGIPEEEQVTQAIEDILQFALNNTKTLVAIPVLNFTGREMTQNEIDTTVTNMQKAINTFIQNPKNVWRGGHIKIVVPSTATLPSAPNPTPITPTNNSTVTPASQPQPIKFGDKSVILMKIPCPTSLPNFRKKSEPIDLQKEQKKSFHIDLTTDGVPDASKEPMLIPSYSRFRKEKDRTIDMDNLKKNLATAPQNSQMIITCFEDEEDNLRNALTMPALQSSPPAAAAAVTV